MKGAAVTLAIMGFIGIVSVSAVFYLDISLGSLILWKIAVVAVLAGYVGADILDSLSEIADKYSKPPGLWKRSND